MSGWVKLYRSTLDSAIDNCPKDTQLLWYKLLQRVNYQPREGYFDAQKIWVRPGQFTTSYKDLSALINCSVSSVRDHIKRLKELGMIKFVTSSTGSLLTIENWFKYQSKYNSFEEIKRCNTNKKQTKNNQSNEQIDEQIDEQSNNKCNNKEVKEGEEEKNKKRIIFDYFVRKDETIDHRKMTGSMKSTLRARLKEGWNIKELKKTIDNYCQILRDMGRDDTKVLGIHTSWTLDELFKRSEGEKANQILKNPWSFYEERPNNAWGEPVNE